MILEHCSNNYYIPSMPVLFQKIHIHNYLILLEIYLNVQNYLRFSFTKDFGYDRIDTINDHFYIKSYPFLRRRTEMANATKEQQGLIQELDKAKADKNDKLQRKFRKLLRESGWFISKGGPITKEELAEWSEKKKKRSEKRRKNRSKKVLKNETPAISLFEFDEDTSLKDIKKQRTALNKQFPKASDRAEITKEFTILKAYVSAK